SVRALALDLGLHRGLGRGNVGRDGVQQEEWVARIGAAQVETTVVDDDGPGDNNRNGRLVAEGEKAIVGLEEGTERSQSWGDRQGDIVECQAWIKIPQHG